MSNLIMVYDCETTGTQHWRHCIHQLAGAIYIDDVLQERFDFKIRPHEKAHIDEAALKAGGVTLDQITSYPHRTEQFNKFKALLNKYVDPYNPEQKMFMLGYNNSWFDGEFLRNLFILEDDGSFGCYFWPNCVDVMVLASYYLMPDRNLLPSFKLSRVAKYLGIHVDDSKLHEALYDVELTWGIYKIVRGKTIDDF